MQTRTLKVELERRGSKQAARGVQFNQSGPDGAYHTGTGSGPRAVCSWQGTTACSPHRVLQTLLQSLLALAACAGLYSAWLLPETVKLARAVHKRLMQRWHAAELTLGGKVIMCANVCVLHGCSLAHRI